jgi:hypothetical protein
MDDAASGETPPMTVSLVAAIVMFGLLITVAVKKFRRPPRRAQAARRRPSIGPAASGAFFELLNEEKRNAIEVAVQDKAAYRDSEHADDTPPARGH